jgi:hypothetical protein
MYILLDSTLEAVAVFHIAYSEGCDETYEFENFYSYMQYLGSWYEAYMKVISRGPFPGNLSASDIKDKITW